MFYDLRILSDLLAAEFEIGSNDTFQYALLKRVTSHKGKSRYLTAGCQPAAVDSN